MENADYRSFPCARNAVGACRDNKMAIFFRGKRKILSNAGAAVHARLTPMAKVCDNACMTAETSVKATSFQVRHPELVGGSIPSRARKAGGTDPSASLGMTFTTIIRIQFA
jgi:hypothetical protein